MDIIDGTNIYIGEWLHGDSLPMINDNLAEADPLPGGGDGEGDFGGVEGREGRLFTKFLLLFEAFAFGAEVREEVGGGAVGAVLGDEFALDGGLEDGFAHRRAEVRVKPLTCLVGLAQRQAVPQLRHDPLLLRQRRKRNQLF